MVYREKRKLILVTAHDFPRPPSEDCRTVASRPAPPLSVVIGTTQGWPDVRPCLEALRIQAAAVGAEVIVADGSAVGPPEGEDIGRGIRWLCRPGAGVVELRALATQEAQGEIVAVTEDHCVVSPDWCARILDAHARHPGAAAIRGAVVNGSRDHLIDWAAFLTVQAPHLAPFVGRDTDSILPMSCVSYKRWALEQLPALHEPWPVELRDYREWLRAGHALIADAQIWVAHHQSVGFVRASGLQFHNARAFSGIRRRRMARRDWIRLATAVVLPFYRTVRTASICLGKRAPRGTLIAALPLILWFYCCKGAGEIAGYLAGPGDSPLRTL